MSEVGIEIFCTHEFEIYAEIYIFITTTFLVINDLFTKTRKLNKHSLDHLYWVSSRMIKLNKYKVL